VASNESDVDRLVREHLAARQAQQRQQVQVLDFLEASIDHAVGYVAPPIVKGLQQSIGACSPTLPSQHRKGSRVFSVFGESRRHGIRVELEVHVNGIPQMVNDPRGVLYWLHIDGRVLLNGRLRKRFSIEPAENPTGRPIPTEQLIAQTINAQVAQMLGI
jgi:hypothetical protein